MGKNERNTDLNRRRLHNVKACLTQYRKGSFLSTHTENIILAFGENTNGRGVVQIYFKGELLENIASVSKNMLCKKTFVDCLSLQAENILQTY